MPSQSRRPSLWIFTPCFRGLHPRMVSDGSPDGTGVKADTQAAPDAPYRGDSAVDPGYAVDTVHGSPLNQPHSPDQPHKPAQQRSRGAAGRERCGRRPAGAASSPQRPGSEAGPPLRIGNLSLSRGLLSTITGAVKAVTHDGRPAAGTARFAAGGSRPFEDRGNRRHGQVPHDREGIYPLTGGKILRDHEGLPGMRGQRGSRGRCDYSCSAAAKALSWWPLPVRGRSRIVASMARRREAGSGSAFDTASYPAGLRSAVMDAVEVVTRDERTCDRCRGFYRRRLLCPFGDRRNQRHGKVSHDREGFYTRNGCKILRDHEGRPGMRGQRGSRGGCDYLCSAGTGLFMMAAAL